MFVLEASWGRDVRDLGQPPKERNCQKLFSEWNLSAFCLCVFCSARRKPLAGGWLLSVTSGADWIRMEVGPLSSAGFMVRDQTLV